MKKSIIIALLVANILGVLSPFLSSATSRAYAQEPTILAPIETQEPPATQPETSSACKEMKLGEPGGWAEGFVCNFIRVSLLKFAIGGLYITSKAFDYAVNLTLFDLNKAMSESSLIYILWSWIRDFCNIVALFLFFIALFLSSISDKGVEARKYLVKVIIFAIFLNFSFPIAKGVIDISNVVALNIYGSLTQYRFQDNAIQGKVINDFGLSHQLMQVLGIQDPIARVGTIEKAPNVIKGIDSVVTILGLVMLVCAMAVVFAQAFMLIATRLVMIFLCIVTSPFMFMGGILPPNSPINLDEYVDRWLKAFFGSAFFAPILMIAIGLAIEIMKFAMNLGGGTTGLGATDSLLQLVLMVICIIIFQKSIEYSATLMDGVGQRAAAIGARMGGKMMSAGIARPAAFLTRNTVGRGVSRVLGPNEEKWLNKKKDEGGLRGRIASGTLKGLDSIRGLKSVQGFNDSIRNSSMDMMGRGTALMSLGTVNNIRANQGSLIRDDERVEDFKNRKDEKVEKEKAKKAKSGAEQASKKASELSEMASTYDNLTEMYEKDLEKIKTEAASETQKIKDELDIIKKRTDLIENGKVRDRDNNITSEKLQTLRNMRQTLKREMDEATARGDTVTADGKRMQLEQVNQVYEEYREQIGLKELEGQESDAKNRLENLEKKTAEELIENEEGLAGTKDIAQEKRTESIEVYNKSNELAAEAEARNESAGTLKAAREAYKAKYRAGDDAENAVNSLSLESLAQMYSEIGAANTADRAAAKAKAEASYKAKYDKEAASQMKTIMAALAKNAAAGGHGPVPPTPKPTASVPIPKPVATPKPATATPTGGGSSTNTH